MVQSDQALGSQPARDGGDDAAPDASEPSADPDQPPPPEYPPEGDLKGCENPSNPASNLAIDIVDAQGEALSGPEARWLRDRFTAAARFAGATQGRVTLAVVDDATMADLHQQYKGVAGATDVLTFDLRHSGGPAAHEPAAPLDVDLVLCRDEAARQAGDRGHEVRLELLLYAVHGLLHTMGFDDADEAEAAAMHAREDEILTALGLGPVFARQAPDQVGQADEKDEQGDLRS